MRRTTTRAYALATTLVLGLSGCAAAGADGRIYAIGGLDGTSGLSTLEVYTPRTDSWAAAPSMQTPRWGLAAAGAGGCIYAVGGYDGTKAYDTAEAYAP